MLWSIIKIFIFVAMAVALAFGVAWILETPGQVVIAFAGREWSLSHVGTLIALGLLIVAAIVVLKILGFLVALSRFLLGDETALSRYFNRARERQGYRALSEGMIALAAGDSPQAVKQAAKAERLLGRREVTDLVQAQAAELSGNSRKATGYYKAMLADDRTRFVGVSGLMQQKLEEGDTEKALALAKKAFALRPDNPALLGKLFDLQSQQADWAGARDTLNASLQAKMLPRDVATRRDAVLSLADARAAAEEGNIARRNDAALQANKLAPTLVPAAVLASQVYVEKQMARKAQKVLVRTWAANPHPDLAAAFAAIVPDETPEERLRRFRLLIDAAPKATESRLLSAELSLAAEDFPAARKALGDLVETEPTTRSLALMAAIERGLGAPEAEVRAWLAKAIDAPRGPQWVCEVCGNVEPVWVPVCSSCGAFDTLVWKTPPADAGQTAGNMLPLLVDPPEAGGVEDADATVDVEPETARAATA
ncbi:MAG: heme biosynthesis HemY N-terminal domain-containing protein [Pseudomonadota bacterium]